MSSADNTNKAYEITLYIDVKLCCVYLRNGTFQLCEVGILFYKLMN